MSSDNSESEQIPYANKRKKGGDRSLYKNEKIKKARVKNEEYTNYKGNVTQPNNNVFDVHNLADDKAMFYVYHEGLAKKGPNEVCSFLMNYFDNVLDKNVKHLHLFSDGTGGQNKNNTVVRFFLALVEIGRFDSVHHYFPIRGHSYLPCDRDFSAVKRKIKKTDRVYTVREYVELISTSTVNIQKFCVTMVDPSDVKDFNSWWPVV